MVVIRHGDVIKALEERSARSIIQRENEDIKREGERETH